MCTYCRMGGEGRSYGRPCPIRYGHARKMLERTACRQGYLSPHPHKIFRKGFPPSFFPESENGDIRNSIGHKLRYIVGGRSLAQISPPPLPFFFFSGASPPHLRSESIPLLLLLPFLSPFPSVVPYNKHMCAA